MFVYMINPDDEETPYYQGGKFQCYQRDIHLELKNLEPGSYVLFTEVDWNGTQSTDKYFITSYGPNKVSFDEYEGPESMDALRAAASAILDQGLQTGDLNEENPWDGAPAVTVYSFSSDF